MTKSIVPIVVIFLALLGTEASLGCGPTSQTATTIVIDCTRQHRADIVALVAEFRTLLDGSSPDWAAVEQRAIAAGRDIGGCALAEAFDWVLSRGGSQALRQGDASSIELGHDTLERFRTNHADGAVFLTPGGYR